MDPCYLSGTVLGTLDKAVDKIITSLCPQNLGSIEKKIDNKPNK